MTEECNCLPLKQIPSCPFKTSENMHFFFKISGVSASATCWPVLESAGVLECKVLDSRAVPLSACKQMISLLVGNCFPTYILPFTQEFVPVELGHAECCAVLLGALSPEQRVPCPACPPCTCALALTGCWGPAMPRAWGCQQSSSVSPMAISFLDIQE